MNLTLLVMMKFFAGATATVTAPAIAGPFCFHEGVSYVPGGTEGEYYVPGGTEGEAACQEE